MSLAEELCAAAPTVMVIDDLQWADDASLLIWHQLAASIDQLRLLLIATCRPSPRRPQVQQVRAAVVRRGGAVITLGPLPETDVAELGSDDTDAYAYLRERWPTLLVHGVAALIAGRRDQRTKAGQHLRLGLALPIQILTDRENPDFLLASHALALEQSGETRQAMLRLAAMLPRRDAEMTLTRGAGRRRDVHARGGTDVHRAADAEPADPAAGGDGGGAAAAAPAGGRAADRGGQRAAGGVPGGAVPGRSRGEPDPAGGGPGPAAAAVRGAAGPARGPGRGRGVAAAGRGQGRRCRGGLDRGAAGRGVLPVLRRRVDAGLGWLTAAGQDGPAALEVMSLGDFEPDVWLPPGMAGPGDRTGRAGGPGRRPRSAPLSPVTYDAWLAVLREADPRFEFTDPEFRRLLPITLAFAASTSRPTAVLTGPHHRLGDWPGPAEPDPAADPAGLVRARIHGSPLTATAALAWSPDLPRPLQQVLFDTADSIIS